MAMHAPPLHIGPAELQAAYAAGRRSSWPASFEATQCHPLYRRLLRCEAVRRALAQQRAARAACITATPTVSQLTMHLTPCEPVATDARPGDAPPQHGALGSAARLAVLLYLAHRPQGATKEVLSHIIGLDAEHTIRVLTALRRDQRIACARTEGLPLWYVPAARAAGGGWALAAHDARMLSARGLSTTEPA
jgi:hypothetical protein